MTRLRDQTDAVRPSAPDPVDAWLDLLVSMLSTPKAERQRVRDELEDHLRSRVDDLLIHGLTEAAALQKAVAELGETADLARQLSHAHRPPRTRRYAMNALLIALTGTVVALGVSVVRPPAAPAPAGPPDGSLAAVHPGADRPADRPADGLGADLLATTVSVTPGRQVAIQSLLERFAEKLALRLEVDHARLRAIGLAGEHTVSYHESHRGEVTLGGALDQILNAADYDLWTNPGGSKLVAAEMDGALVITTADGLDERTTSRRVYPLGRFTQHVEDASSGDSRVAFEHLYMAITEHVFPDEWRENGGELATGTLLGASLIVTAPARVHAQVEALLDELHAQSVEQAAEREAAHAALREAAAAEHRKLLDRVRIEYDRAVHQQTSEAERIERIRGEIFHAQIARANAKDDEIDRIHSELSDAAAELKRREISLEEAAARVEYLRARMIELEYEPLAGEGQHETRSASDADQGVVIVRGLVPRAGVYNLRPGTTLGAMLETAGGLAAPAVGKVQLIRGAHVLGEWPVDRVPSTYLSRITLRPGDTVSVVD